MSRLICWAEGLIVVFAGQLEANRGEMASGNDFGELLVQDEGISRYVAVCLSSYGEANGIEEPQMPLITSTRDIRGSGALVAEYTSPQKIAGQSLVWEHADGLRLEAFHRSGFQIEKRGGLDAESDTEMAALRPDLSRI